MPDREPPLGRLGSSQVLALVAMEEWSEAIKAVQEWPTEEREKLTGATLVMPIDGHRLVPVGLRVFGSFGSALPVTDSTVLADAAAVVNVPLADATPLSVVIERTVDALFTASWERVRDANRNPAWKQAQRQQMDPREISAQLREDYADQIAGYQAHQEDVTGLTASLLIELCDEVANEDGKDDGFAAALASIDVARIAETTNAYVELLDTLVTLGLIPQADGHSGHATQH